MKELTISNHKAIFIHHNCLINEAYNKNSDSSCSYSLSPHLFDFKPKLLPPCTNRTKRRKRKFVPGNYCTETYEMKNICDMLTTKLKQMGTVFQLSTAECNIERIWEEPTEFPQFKGVNQTNQFQNFTLNCKEYLIPPFSKFFNHDLMKFSEISIHLEKYDFVVMDPPWRNKYIRRVKKAKQELGYKMLDDDLLSDIPLNELIHCNSIIAVWCTNSQQHQRKLLEEFFPRWDLKLLSKVVWLKLNTEGTLIGEINDEGKKQPYEVLFIGHHIGCSKDLSTIKAIDFLSSVPSIIHSHKPPISQLFQDVLPTNSKCLELFARYLQPGFTSIGLEVIKLMDKRLYVKHDKQCM